MIFETFYTQLTSDQQWFENVSSRHKPETFKNVCRLVWTLALSDAEQMKVTPIADHRRHVVYKLSKILPDKDNSKQWFQLEEEKKEAEEKKEWVPASDEHVAKCVADFDEMIKNSHMMTNFPPMTNKQKAEQGDWLPPKGPVYKMTTAMEAYNKERKIAYYRYCFDPITRDKLSTWMPEEDYNAEFDRIMVKKKKHPNWEILREIEG
jgi:hypothetical protein